MALRISIASILDAALRAAGIPIVGVSVPTTDRATWVVEFDPSATAQQQADAAGIVAALDVTEPALATKQREQERKRDLDVLVMKALARAVHVRFGRADAATMSAATWRSILEAAWELERG